MNIRKNIFSLIIIMAVSIAAIAQAGKSEQQKVSTLSAQSESGKVKFTVKILDGEDRIISAEMVSDQGTLDLLTTYDAVNVIDMPNHILTIGFLEKVKPTDNPEDAKLIKVWATPSSFVKTPGGEYNWRFKLKVGGNVLSQGIIMNGTLEQPL